MDKTQIRNSGILVISNLVINATGFLRQLLMAWLLGISAQVDLLLLAMVVPAIIQSMIGGGAGEILVIKREKEGLREGSFEALFIVACLVPVMLLGAMYYLSIGLVEPFFEIEAVNTVLFRELSLIFIASMLPGTFISVLRPHLYSKGLYGFYGVSAVVSQLAGIVLIVLTVNRSGIHAFAWSYLFANLLNAVWLSFRSGLHVPHIINLSVWKNEAGHLMSMMRKVFSLSLQTFLNHFATFWERSLSVKYLTAGYLSSLNYSKTLTELPNTVLLSSVLTTSYIKQAELHKSDPGKFTRYTSDTLALLIRAGFLFQMIMLLLAPVIIITVFRRGRFGNEAVQTCLVIFNILMTGLLPQLIMSFLTRTMYILGEYRRLLLAVFLKFLIQAGLMVSFVTLAGNAIPLALVTGLVFTALLLYVWVGRKTKLPSPGYFAARLLIVSAISAAFVIIHSITIGLYIDRSNGEILVWSLPAIILSGIVTLIFMSRNGIEPAFVTRIRSSVWKRKA